MAGNMHGAHRDRMEQVGLRAAAPLIKRFALLHRDEWRQRAVMLDAAERGVIVDRYQTARDGLQATLTRPADAARLLERLREAHGELRALYRGETTPAQRARIEQLTRRRLAEGFELAVRAGVTWGDL